MGVNKWKLLGLAGLAGVAATGVIIARDERRRAQMSPEEVRARLRQRLADVEGTAISQANDSQSDYSRSDDSQSDGHQLNGQRGTESGDPAASD